MDGGTGHVQETTKEAALAAVNSALSKAGVEVGKEEEMSISQEILVLDLGDELAQHYKSGPKQEVSETDPYYTNCKHMLTKCNIHI